MKLRFCYPEHFCVLVILLAGLLVISCKTSVPAASSGNLPAPVTRPETNPSPGDSVYCLTQSVLYRELTTKNRWEDAVIPWRRVFGECLPENQNFYIDGINIYKNLIKKSTDSSVTASLEDTVFLLYDRRMALFDNKGFVSGRKGLDLLNYRPNDRKEAFDCLLFALHNEKNNTQAIVLQSLVSTAIALNQERRLDTTLVLKVYAEVKDVIFYNLKENIRDTLLYLQANRGVDQVFLPWADCKLLSSAYKDRVEKATPEELENIVHVFELVRCFDLPVFRRATERLYELKPGPVTAFYQGLNAFTRGDYSSALTYFNESAEQFTEAEKKSAAYVGAGRTYEAMQQYGQAREMGRKALGADPRNGRAYLLIGDVYSASARDCGNGDQLSEESVYWAAADQYRLAAQADPSVADEAKEKLSACRAHFPSKKLLFFHQLQSGATFTVGCWIKEKTIVRERPE